MNMKSEGPWGDNSQPQAQAIFNQYVQYPTSHMPSQKAVSPEVATPENNGSQMPANQPKLSNKNPVMHLNELINGLVYDIQSVSQTEEPMKVEGEPESKKKKPTKQTTYTANVKVQDEEFTGTAKSIKLAKQEAAKYALLKKFNILYVPGYDNIPEEAGNIFVGTKRKAPNNTGPSTKKQKQQVPKNALMALNEKKPGLSYNVISQTGAVHAPTFVIAVEIDGQTFQGQGTSKKIARTEAAQNACRALNIPFVVGNP